MIGEKYIHLTSADRIVIRDKDVFVFHGIHGFDPRPLQGSAVMVDGALYVCTRVGTFAVVDPTGMPFELMLRPMEAEG